MESIRITNITQRANGTQSVIIYDKAAPGLSSGGSTACYRPAMPTVSPRAVARRLQQIDETAIMVDYAIVDPPVEILEPAAFVTAVTGDVGLSAIIAEAGASGLEAVVPPEVVDYAAAATPIEPPVQVVENRIPLYIGIAIGATGLVAAAVAIARVMKKRVVAKPLTTRVEVVELNPTVRVLGASERQMFVPGQIRV